MVEKKFTEKEFEVDVTNTIKRQAPTAEQQIEGEELTFQKRNENELEEFLIQLSLAADFNSLLDQNPDLANFDWDSLWQKTEKPKQLIELLAQFEEPKLFLVNEKEILIAESAPETPLLTRNRSYEQALAAATSLENGDLLTEEEYKVLNSNGKLDREAYTWIKSEALPQDPFQTAQYGRGEFGRVIVERQWKTHHYDGLGYRSVLRWPLKSD